jgi:hypothetical protein
MLGPKRRGRRTLNLVLAAAAGGLALATICALAARLWWAFDLFSRFRLQSAVLAAAFCSQHSPCAPGWSRPCWR